MKLSCFICLYVCLTLTHTIELFAQSPSKTDTVVENNINIFSSVYRKVIDKHPAALDQEQLLLAGINPMLQSIDEFTILLTRDEAIEFKRDLSAQFGGIGIVMGNSSEGIFVQELFPDKPAEKAGLRTSDIIKEIDGITISGKTIDDVRSMLIGTPGSPVSVTVLHRGEKKNTTYTFNREIITLNAVPYYGMLGDDIAYLKLSRESEGCSEEVKTALRDLYNKHQFKGLIFDLRGNEGGQFDEAIKLANLFVEKGSLLSSIRSKNTDTTYYSMEAADYPSMPLILLTDQYTASAGEVLSGALQDNDRAIVIGQSTYGKGYVQVLFNMPGETLLKLTTGRYYTPSGRCLQAFDYAKGNKTIKPDSLRKEFRTKNGRTVYSSGGITPDIITTSETPPGILQTLERDLHIFDFIAGHFPPYLPGNTQAGKYLSEEDYVAFIDFIKKRDLNYLTETEIELAVLKEAAQKDGYWHLIQPEIELIENKIKDEKELALSIHQDFIKRALEEEITARYGGQKSRFELKLKYDKEVAKALEIISDPIVFNKILHPEKN